LVVLDRVAQVSPHRVAEVVEVLHEERLIEPELMADGSDLLLGCLRPERDPDGITRDQVDQHEGDEREPKEDDRRLRPAPSELTKRHAGTARAATAASCSARCLRDPTTPTRASGSSGRCCARRCATGRSRAGPMAHPASTGAGSRPTARRAWPRPACGWR